MILYHILPGPEADPIEVVRIEDIDRRVAELSGRGLGWATYFVTQADRSKNRRCYVSGAKGHDSFIIERQPFLPAVH